MIHFLVPLYKLYETLIWILITLLNKGRGLLDVVPPTSVLGPSNLVAACYFLFHFIFNVLSFVKFTLCFVFIFSDFVI